MRRLLSIAILACGCSWSQSVEEYQLKAVFLFNFAKFVEWPADAFASSRDPITICIVGENPFGDALKEAVNGKSVEGRGFDIREISAVDKIKHCQILFIRSSERQQLRSTAAENRTASVLIVGESEGFAKDGGVINFKVEGEKLRIQINLSAAEERRIRISSRLLSLAQIVKK